MDKQVTDTDVEFAMLYLTTKDYRVEMVRAAPPRKIKGIKRVRFSDLVIEFMRAHRKTKRTWAETLEARHPELESEEGIKQLFASWFAIWAR